MARAKMAGVDEVESTPEKKREITYTQEMDLPEQSEEAEHLKVGILKELWRLLII